MERDTTMRVMVIVKATRESEAEIKPGDEKLLKEMGAFNEELVKAGIMLAGEGLKPSKLGKRVRFSGANRTVIDGPFTETKELVAGYWVWQEECLLDVAGGMGQLAQSMSRTRFELHGQALFYHEHISARR